MFSFIVSLFAFLHVHKPVAFAKANKDVISVKSISLDDRYPVKSVNDVFKRNILLTLAYMKQQDASHIIDVKDVDKPQHVTITLHKGDVFAFHDSVLPSFSGKVVQTTHAHFNGQEGYLSDGFLIGDGVCHLASLIDYAASSAGLGVFAPTSHDFAVIPEVPKQYGVAIYTTPSQPGTSAEQNLYVTNTLAEDIILEFDYQNSTLTVSVVKLNS